MLGSAVLSKCRRLRVLGRERTTRSVGDGIPTGTSGHMSDRLVRPVKNWEWIYRFLANPGMPRGGIVPPPTGLGPGSASGRVPALPYPPPRNFQC